MKQLKMIMGILLLALSIGCGIFLIRLIWLIANGTGTFDILTFGITLSVFLISLLGGILLIRNAQRSKTEAIKEAE